MGTRALVLGGGGIAGIAWEIGLLAGLADAGVDVTDADLVVGTSAGSVVGSLITTGNTPDRLYAAQLEPGAGKEKRVDFDAERMMAAFGQALDGTTDPQEIRKRIGAIALSADTVPAAERREIIAARLPSHDWPERALRITAVDTETGDWVAFGRDSGVSLVDAVAASCAVPGVWPPAEIDGKRYMDGGIRSIVNADLADGYDQVLVLAPLSPPPGGPMPSVEDEVRAMRGKVELIVADQDSTTAFGLNPLDPATRIPSARAGFAQAKAHADTVRALWVS